MRKLLFLVSVVAFSQAWNGIISSGRAVDWSTAGVSGGIPTRTTVCATLNPGATSAQINSAIQSCPSGQVVYLNAGTYNLSAGITFNNKSNVTLRGAGANQTLLVFSGPDACHGTAANICLDSTDTNWPGGPTRTATWSGSGPWPKGTTQITLSNTTGLAVGNLMTLDQLNDNADAGGIYVCETVAGGCNDDGPSGGSSGGQRTDRAQQQLVTVTNINAGVVTFTPGLYMPNWRASQSPGAWWATSPIKNSGVEDMSLDHTNSTENAGVQFFNCLGCWVKGIRSITSDRSHVLLLQSARCTIRDSYFYGTKNTESQSYGIEFFPSSDTLVENNIFQRVTAPQVVNASCSGCVIGYNYSIFDRYTASASWMSHAAFMHAGGVDNLLLEGNVGAGLYSDLFHGTHHFITAFRNRYNGFETGKTSQTIPMALWPFSRYYNIIGNVLGDTARPHTNYTKTPGGGGVFDQSIFVVGTGAVYMGDDAQVAATLMRWGNYDVVNGSVRWQSAEVPTGLSDYPNSVPASQILPNSFYLAARPSWFRTVTWPPIGPDVSGGNIANTGGYANRIPAQECYTSVMGGPADGSGAVLSFNANTCYGATYHNPTKPACGKGTSLFCK